MGDDRSGAAYHAKWEAIARTEEAAAIEDDEAMTARSDAALGLREDAPRSAAEANERNKREALKAAKALWKDQDAAALAKKAVVENESGVVKTLTQEDLGEDKHAMHIKGARGCEYTLDARMRVAKVFVEGCEECVVRIACVVVAQHVEVWACRSVKVVLDAPVATVQVDGSAAAEVAYARGDMLGAVVHATCADLRVSFADGAPGADLVAAQAAAEAELRHAAPSPPDAGEDEETPQYITRRVDGEVLTERVVRGKDEYPTTRREMIQERAEAAAQGNAAAAAAIAADVPVEVDTRSGRAETRKEKGNEAFKEGNYSQAVVFYTQALDLVPEHHVALANRSACFLKLGEHERALSDAEACVAANAEFVKGHFRKGLSLHALGRFGEAVGALEKAERLDPKNKQVVEALRMAAYKARKQAEEGRE